MTELFTSLSAVAAVIAVTVSSFQVYRDRRRERAQAKARAKSAKLLISAFYSSALAETNELISTLKRGAQHQARAVDQARSLRDDQQLNALFQAMLMIDASALPVLAMEPFGRAQAMLITLRSTVNAVAAARFSGAPGAELAECMRALKTVVEEMRGEIPFKLDNRPIPTLARRSESQPAQ
jgi:hypothetical protein